MTFDELKKLEDKIVVLYLSDGERLKAKLMLVDLEYDDVIVDVLETTQPEHYRRGVAVYALPNKMIKSAEVCESELDDPTRV